MHKRRKENFNTIIVKKSSVFRVTFSGLIIILSFAFVIKNAFQVSEFKQMLIGEIPVICNSSKNLDNLKTKLMHDIKTHLVFAEALPMVEFLRVNNNEKISPPSPVTEIGEVIINENTFPVKDTQIIAKNLEIRNETTYAPDIYSLLYAPLSFKNPEILIVHTHGSESYKNDDLNYYHETDSDRTTDTQLNVIRVGEELAKELNKYGFKVTHAKDINDYPSYNKSYNKTLEVINYYLKRNKNIQVVLDIHRDSIVKNDGTKLKFTSKIDNENVAQVMIVCGTNQAGLDNDTWQENLKFALKMQNFMEINYPGFARPLNLRQERFNTHATTGSMIIEVGTSGNTLQEALQSTKYLANTIKEILLPYN